MPIPAKPFSTVRSVSDTFYEVGEHLVMGKPIFAVRSHAVSDNLVLKAFRREDEYRVELSKYELIPDKCRSGIIMPVDHGVPYKGMHILLC